MIGKRITALRQEKRLTQQAVAEVVGLARATYAHYETDRHKPDDRTLCKLATFFNVTTDYLRGNTDLRKPYILSGDPLLYERLLAEVGEEGITPAGIHPVNLALSGFMKENKISKIKIRRDRLPQSGLPAESLEKLAALIKQIKTETTGEITIRSAFPHITTRR